VVFFERDHVLAQVVLAIEEVDVVLSSASSRLIGGDHAGLSVALEVSSRAFHSQEAILLWPSSTALVLSSRVQSDLEPDHFGLPGSDFASGRSLCHGRYLRLIALVVKLDSHLSWCARTTSQPSPNAAENLRK
jgi:hypothetical protein